MTGLTDADLERIDCLNCAAPGGRLVVHSPAQMSTTKEPFSFVECGECQLIRLQPRVRAASIARYYDEAYLPHRGASAWGRFAPLVERAQMATDRARLRRVLAATKLTARSRLLDLGCGQPTFLRLVREQTGATAVGVDFSSAGWNAAPEQWPGLQLHQGTLDSLDLEGGFNAITLWHSLEHEYDPLAVLRRLRSLAKPGGAALIAEVPNFDSWTRRLHGPSWAGFHTPRHTAAFTPSTLARLLVRAGWQIEKQLTFGTLDPYVLWWLGHQEQQGRSLQGDLAPRFVPFVLGKVLSWPLVLAQRWLSLGIQTVIARSP